MTRILIPTQGPNDWQRFLAEPEKHWKTGFSARALAHCWEDAEKSEDGLPASVKRVLCARNEFEGLKVLLAIPEHQVPLPGGSRPTQSDIWVLGSTEVGLVSISVEGKVSETFGPTVDEWMKDASPGKRLRLNFLLTTLGLPTNIPGDIRYQLLHRMTSAVLEAGRFQCVQALLLVHSFTQSDAWLPDYQRFLGLFGAKGVCGEVSSLGETNGVGLHAAWVRGEAEYLER